MTPSVGENDDGNARAVRSGVLRIECFLEEVDFASIPETSLIVEFHEGERELGMDLNRVPAHLGPHTTIGERGDARLDRAGPRRSRSEPQRMVRRREQGTTAYE